MDNNEIRSFWDIDQYRRVIKRIENGYRSCENFLSMVQERAEIELRYAKSLRKWTEKWTGVIEKGAEYGSTVEVWRTCLQEGSVVAQIHEDCRLKIMGEEGPFYNMYKWKKDHYHKGSFGTLQEARVANDGFASAQKEFARLLTKIERAKKAYHAACVSAHKARLFAEEEATDESVRPEFKRKLQQRASKFAAQRERVKQVYLKRVMKCNGPAKDHYIQEMTGEITRWQALERARLDAIHAQLLLFVRTLDGVSSTNLSEIYQQLEENIAHADSLRDVQDWDAKFGTGCAQHWPRFEEMNVDEVDAAAYAEAERKSSFGSALMHRRRQRSNHRRSHNAIFSSVAEFDEDEFTDDDFDSTFDDSEELLDDQEVLQSTEHHHDQDGTHRPISRHQVLPEHRVGGHSSQHRQPYGHRVTNLTRLYDGKLQGGTEHGHSVEQSGGLQEEHRLDRMHGYDVRYDDYSKRDNRIRTDHLGHQTSGHHVRHERHRPHQSHYPQHDQDHRYRQQHSPSSPRSTAYHATQWHDNHTWQPVSYEYGGRTSGTPPKREVEIPTRDAPPQRYSVRDDSPKVSGQVSPQVLSQSDHKTTTTPVQSYHQAHIPQYHANLNSSYSNQVSGGRAQLTSTYNQAVPRAVPAANYQATGTPDQRQMTNLSTQVQTPRPSQPAVVGPTTPSSETRSEESQRHERHATMNQAKHLLHLEDGEFMVRAMYDFKPGTRDELPLKSGEVLVQTGKHAENGWAFGRNLERTGIFPSSYVQVVR